MLSRFEVVVSGISGRFPECEDIATFKEKLYATDTFLTTDERKWPNNFKLYRTASSVENSFIGNVPNTTGKFVNKCDYDFTAFKFNRSTGRSNDITNRKLLEPSFEAVADAGLNPYSLSDRNIGVFVSTGLTDTDCLYDVDTPHYVFILGGSKTMASNRISFAMDLRGPSYTYQANVLGSMEALREGYRSVADGRIEAAIVGVSSFVNDPKVSIALLNYLSPDGLCRSFDKSANGYGRSDGVVVFFLQRAEDAKRIYGSVLFCDTYYFGSNSHSFVKYDETAIKTCLKNIYDCNDGWKYLQNLSYMELDGCGIERIENMETNAVAYLMDGIRKEPLKIGSVKSVVGHTEAASAHLSVLKALLALDSNVIAPNDNFSQLNDRIKPLKEGKFQVVHEKTKLIGDTVAVNSIGLGGHTNHVILKQNSRAPKSTKSEDELPRLVLICGRTKESLKEAIRKIERLPYSNELVSLINDVFGSHMPYHIYGGFTVLPKSVTSVSEVEERGDRNRPVWFVFSGMGSQWNGMGIGLLNIPIFAELIKKCDAVLRPKSIDIYEILTTNDESIFDNIVASFVGIICVQIGLFELLKTLKIQPDGIIGHSVGENGCAYADGCLTLEQAVMASYERGMASVEAKTIKGMMAAVGKGYHQMKDSLPDDVQIACRNSANSCTLTGPAEKINHFVDQLKKQGVFAKSVNVANIAYHSKFIAPAAPLLLSKLKSIIPNAKQRSPKWISTSVPESEWSTPISGFCSAEYLTNNLLNPVLFEEGCEHIPKNAIVIEIAPHGLLQAILKRSLPESCTNIALTRRNLLKTNTNILLNAIGRMYIEGCYPDVNAIYPKIEYPVSREVPAISPFCTWLYEDDYGEDIFVRTALPPLSSEIIPIRINDDAEYNYLKHHKLNGQSVIPPSVFLYLTWYVFSIKRNEKFASKSITFENIKMAKNVKISLHAPKYVSVLIQASGNFEVTLEQNKSQIIEEAADVVMKGRIEVVETDVAVDEPTMNITEPNDKYYRTLNHRQIYKIFENAGYDIDDCFALIQRVDFTHGEYSANVQWNGNWVTFLDSFMKFQTLSKFEKLDTFYPYSIRKLTIYPLVMNGRKIGANVLCHRSDAMGRATCDAVHMYDFVYKSTLKNTLKSSKRLFEIRPLKFVSYEKPQCENIDNFLKLCFEIVFENTLNATTKTNGKLFVNEITQKYCKNIRAIVEGDARFESLIRFENTQQILSSKLPDNDSYHLFITNDIDAIRSTGTADARIFAILCDTNTTTTDDWKSENLKFYSTITAQTFGADRIVLLKQKMEQRKPQRVTSLIENRDPKYTRSNGREYVDMSGYIRKDITTGVDVEIEPVYEKCCQVNSLSQMLSAKKRQNLRYDLQCDKRVFVMDEKITPSKRWSLNLEDLPKLPHLAYKNGELGAYRFQNYSSAIVAAAVDTVRQEYFVENLKSQCIQPYYIRYDCNKSVSKDGDDRVLSAVEYVGVDEHGTKIMGLASATAADPFFQWPIPNKWSFEEAVTIPFTYCLAYKILSMAEELKMPSCLINMGHDRQALAEICVRLFLNEGFSVYVNVPNFTQFLRIKNQFPQLDIGHIFCNEGHEHKYEKNVKYLTEGKGARMIVNFLPGIERVRTSLRCLDYLSIYVETVDENCRDGHQIGMQSFNLFMTFKFISDKITSLLRLSVEEKKTLQTRVIEGIKNGSVVPFQKMGLIANDGKLVNVGPSSPSTKSNRLNNHSIIKYDGNRTYMIFGERNGHDWVKLIEWLISKRASQFIVVLDHFPNSSRVSQHLNRLLNEKNVNISFVSAQRIDSLCAATNLIDEANKIARLEAIYFVKMSSAGEIIKLMDNALQSNNMVVHLVSLFSGGLQQIESRRSKGFPGVVVHGEYCKNICLGDIVSEFDSIMAKLDYIDTNNGRPTLYEVVNANNETSINTDDEPLTLGNYLPKNVEILARIGYDVCDSAKFIQKPSLAPLLEETKGVKPIFVVPAIHHLLLESLTKKIIYPVFCARLSKYPKSIRQTATELFENLNEIQPEGPVTVVGELWNAPIALELAFLIKQWGRTFKLFLLHGDPCEWKKQTQYFSIAINSQKFENIFVDCLRVRSGDSTKMPLSNVNHHNNSFEQLVREYVAANNLIDVDPSLVIEGVGILRRYLSLISTYKLSNEILENTILFLPRMPIDGSISLRLSIRSEIIVIEEDTYELFINNSKIASTINDEAAFSW